MTKPVLLDSHGLPIQDSLRNLVTGLGTYKDPTHSSFFYLHLLNRQQQEEAYRSDWLARRIIDAPAEDATREWRAWQANKNQIDLLEKVEAAMQLPRKMKLAIIRARLYGGAALVIGVDDGRMPWEPINFDAVKKDSLKFVVVLNRYELNAGPRIYNVNSPWYTRPMYYQVATPLFGFTEQKGYTYPGQPPEPVDPSVDQRLYGSQSDFGMIRIHPNRVCEFTGNELPDWRLAPMGGGWGDSVLQTIWDVLKDFALTTGGAANMVNDAKMDIVKIPGLSERLSSDAYTTKLSQRFQQANAMKGLINTLLLDSEEEWSRIQTSFGAMPQLLETFMVLTCGAGGIPVSRAIGQSPGRGLASKGGGGGEIDLKNYLDTIASKQKNEYKPILEPLDGCLIRAALGKFDPNVDYLWNPLYTPDPKEQAETDYIKAQTFQIDASAGLMNENALREGRVNQLLEDDVYPGLDDAIDEFGSEPETPTPDPTWQPQINPKTGRPQLAPPQPQPPQLMGPQVGGPKPGGPKPGGPKPGLPPPAGTRTQTKDARLESVYVYRPVLNGDEISRWFKRQGFATTLDPSDMHVTVAFSKTPIDWAKAGEQPSGTRHPGGAGAATPEVEIQEGGPRIVDRFGEAVVLVFQSAELALRHEQIGAAGAVYDFPSYQPHITISWQAPNVDVTRLKPWRGPIKLGPEYWEPVRENWKETITEDSDDSFWELADQFAELTDYNKEHWPGGTAGGKGGQFAPAGATAEGGAAGKEFRVRLRRKGEPPHLGSYAGRLAGAAQPGTGGRSGEGGAWQPSGSEWAPGHAGMAVAGYERQTKPGEPTFASIGEDIRQEWGQSGAAAKTLAHNAAIGVAKLFADSHGGAAIHEAFSHAMHGVGHGAVEVAHYAALHASVHAALEALGAATGGPLGVAIVSAATIAAHHFANRTGLTHENAARVLHATVSYAVDHFHEFMRGESLAHLAGRVGVAAATGYLGGPGTHPGHGYTQGAYLDAKGTIHTHDVNDALRALYEGKHVQLYQPREVSTLLDRLAKVSQRMTEMGGKAKNFDLCNVTVKGTNLFCAGSKGIPRIKMPQLPEEQNEPFERYLRAKGVAVDDTVEKPSFLRATQNELVGAKVAGIAQSMRRSGMDPLKQQPIFISRDNYIVDGHHRWAANVGLDAANGRFDQAMPVRRVDMPILDLLREADAFTGGKGHKGTGAAEQRA